MDKDFIIKVYNFANAAHEGQRRESGEPYIIHPIEVACILAELGLDTSTIAAGLLHDIIEDTDYTYEFMAEEFTIEVANMVEGVTKLGKIQYKTKEEQQADNIRKMLMAMAKDVRVILIKLADRLHNLRTLKFMPIDKQKEKAKETFDIYAPLAHRLGISKIKWELEDLSFRYINPNEYYFLVKKIAEKRVEREAFIANIIEELYMNLNSVSINCDIDGRPKHFYSIYKKMMTKNKTIEQIFDLTAIRILVDSVKDCYAALGIVHTIYKPIPGRFKDYIAMPKPNMYQSLHSTVISPQGKTFEIQIRTFEMHKTAEYGIAAHWKYKEGVEGNSNEDFKLNWLREIIEWQRNTSDATEFMEAFKTDLFSDEVFVFTPKGTVIDLPNEATPIDFAYKIHTDIGNKCIGAKVNGKMIPLDYNLKTGEIVEILTSSVPKGPSIDWINIAKSNQAKSKIRAWFKKAKKEENIAKGKELLEKDAKRHGINFGELIKQEVVEQYFKRYNLNSLDDLYVSVGVGDVLASIIVSRLQEFESKGNKIDNVEALKTMEEKVNKNQKSIRNNKSDLGVVVKGVDNILVRFAKCCNAVPGDDIIGYITKGRGVSIHRKDCNNVGGLLKNEDNKIVDVSWSEAKSGQYIGEIEIRAEDRMGFLAELMDVISSSKVHLYAVNAKTGRGGEAVVSVQLKIHNIEDLKELMKKIKKLQGVLEVFRTKN